MITTMDAAGRPPARARLVIPREVRRRAGWRPGTPLEVRWSDGQIEIEPAPVAVTLERSGRLIVAVPRTPVAPLDAATVEEARAALADERGASAVRP